MAANIVNNYISTMMTIYNDVIKAYERNLEVIKQTEDELNDLNHEIELSSPKDMYKGYLLYKDKMQQLQGSAAKLRTTQESRTYVPRQRNDLTITDVHSTASKPFEELLADFNKTKMTKQGGKLRK